MYFRFQDILSRFETGKGFKVDASTQLEAKRSSGSTQPVEQKRSEGMAIYDEAFPQVGTIIRLNKQLRENTVLQRSAFIKVIQKGSRGFSQ